MSVSLRSYVQRWSWRSQAAKPVLLWTLTHLRVGSLNISVSCLNSKVFCSRPFNTPGAIEKAKQNVERDFSVVGSWEDVNVTLTVLENYIPRFFKGSMEIYYGNVPLKLLFRGAQKHLYLPLEPIRGLAFKKQNLNPWKPKISERIKRIMRANFTQEYDFYYFCKQRLYRQYFAINRHLHF